MAIPTVGARECRRIVDAVADHRDRSAATCRRSTMLALPSGRTSATTRWAGMPDLAPIASAAALPSPVTSHVSMPASVNSRIAAEDSARTGSAIVMTPAARPSIPTATIVRPPPAAA
jgi:hypothetical protein